MSTLGEGGAGFKCPRWAPGTLDVRCLPGETECIAIIAALIAYRQVLCPGIPGLPELATIAGYSEIQVGRAIRDLKRRGWPQRPPGRFQRVRCFVLRQLRGTRRSRL